MGLGEALSSICTKPFGTMTVAPPLLWESLAAQLVETGSLLTCLQSDVPPGMLPSDCTQTVSWLAGTGMGVLNVSAEVTPKCTGLPLVLYGLMSRASPVVAPMRMSIFPAPRITRRVQLDIVSVLNCTTVVVPAAPAWI